MEKTIKRIQDLDIKIGDEWYVKNTKYTKTIGWDRRIHEVYGKPKVKITIIGMYYDDFDGDNYETLKTPDAIINATKGVILQYVEEHVYTHASDKLVEQYYDEFVSKLEEDAKLLPKHRIFTKINK